MAKRHNVVKVETSEVQGEGSYVMVSRPSVREIRGIMKVDGDNAATFDVGVKTLGNHIREWDWVDDDGKPFLIPSEDDSVIDQLTIKELQVLFNALLGDEEERKN